ncbi:MAG: TraB/GumN family protein [Cyclobacteriaceae bacterium]|nr:TraB/GumN family protein [Cyclobacteriaceae bacterium]
MVKRIFLLLLVFAIAPASIAHTSILWEVSGNGLSQPSYVLGTLKFVNEKDFFIPGAITQAMDKVQIFAIEDQVDHHHQHELNKAIHFSNGKDLHSVLSPAEYDKTASLFATEFGISRKRFDTDYARMIPLALSITMTRLSLKESLKYYDIELLHIAHEHKLKSFSLEPIEREAEAIQQFPMDEQARALLHSVNTFERQKEEFRQLVQAFRAGDIDKVFEYSQHPTENNPRFTEAFFTQRNKEWLPKIDKMMHEAPALIAVGVSHLEGTSGLLQLLRDKGFTVKPVPVESR